MVPLTSGNDTTVLMFLSPVPKTGPLMEHSWTRKSMPVPSAGVLESSAVASVQTGWAGRGFAFLAVDGNSALLISAHSTSFVPSPLQT